MTEQEYYRAMNTMPTYKSFETLHKKWYECFSYILKSYKKGYNKKIIDSLFYDWDMQNWTALHKEKTEYALYSKDELAVEFQHACTYICDRASYDRLFRTHWLFKNAFEEKIDKIRFPLIYKILKKVKK